MIDVEDEVYTAVVERIHGTTGYENVYVTGVYVDRPPSFPAVYLSMDSNAVWRKGRDQSTMENMNDIGFVCEIYSNKASGKKAECKAIQNIVDDVMGELGITRTLLYPTPNLIDATVYRLTSRYRCIVDKDGRIYYRR